MSTSPFWPAHRHGQSASHERGLQIESRGSARRRPQQPVLGPNLERDRQCPRQSVAQVGIRWLIQREVVFPATSVQEDRWRKTATSLRRRGLVPRVACLKHRHVARPPHRYDRTSQAPTKLSRRRAPIRWLTIQAGTGSGQALRRFLHSGKSSGGGESAAFSWLSNGRLALSHLGRATL